MVINIVVAVKWLVLKFRINLVLLGMRWRYVDTALKMETRPGFFVVVAFINTGIFELFASYI